jgi:hypothetical protein
MRGEDKPGSTFGRQPRLEGWKKEADVGDRDKKRGPGAKSRINKERTSDVVAERAGIDPHAIGGHRKRSGEDLSPDDRERGERSGAEPAGVEDRR